MTEPKPPVKGELDTGKIMKMVADMETIEAFITKGRFVGDSVHISIEHLAECIRKNVTIPADDFGRILECLEKASKLHDYQDISEYVIDAYALARKYGSAE